MSQIVQAYPSQAGPLDDGIPGRLRSLRGFAGSSPGITYGPTRSNVLSTERAGAFRMTVFWPLLLSGKNRQSRSKSTCSHFRCRISLKRQPVKRSRRNAAAADDAIFVDRAAFGTCFAFCSDSFTAQGMPTVSASRIVLSQTLQFLAGQKALATIFFVLFDAACGIGSFWEKAGRARESIHAAYNRQHAVCLKGRTGKRGV